METKVFYKSKVLWTQVFSIVLTVASALALPDDYKLIVVAVVNLLNVVFTVIFRWGSSIPLSAKK